MNLSQLASRLKELPHEAVEGEASQAAVLIALSDENDPAIIYTERSAHLRHHAGQVSFPGGRRDPGEHDPAQTALREAREEVGIDPRRVRTIGSLPSARIPVSAFDVVGVVAIWDHRQPLHIASPTEVEAIHLWRLSALADPANRVTWREPSGRQGPGWTMPEAFLWGFTGYLTDALLRLGGWAREWNRGRVVEVSD